MFSANPKTVLIVDDDLGEIYILQKMLRDFGVTTVQSLINAREAENYLASAAAETHPLPDLIFIDLKMPGIDGFKLIDWVKSKPSLSQIPMVVFSGSIDALDREKALKAGALAFFEKTQELAKLRTIVQTVCPVRPLPRAPSSNAV